MYRLTINTLICMCLVLLIHITNNYQCVGDSINTNTNNSHKTDPFDLSDLPTKFGDEDDVIKITPNHPPKTENANHNSKDGGGKNKNKLHTSHHDIPLPPVGGRGESVGNDDDDDDDDYDEDDVHMSHHYPDKSENIDSDYEEESELGPPLDNFGAKFDTGTTEDSLPVFLLEPQKEYVVRNRPATLKCKAAHALQLSFKCSGSSQPPPSSLESHVDPHTGVRVLEVTATISRDLVDEYFGKLPFKCECNAWSARGKVKSLPAPIEVAYIKKQFSLPPSSVEVELGGRAEIRCNPPNGAPPPKISWLKNGASFNSDPSALVTAEGNILVSHATLQEMANYTCIAENVAGKRTSDAALLTVYVDGGWSSWGQWSECRCPGRLPQGQKRTRSCSNPTPLNGGAPCGGPNIQKTPDCISCPDDTQIVSPEGFELLLAGRWSAWSDWSICNSDCVQTRRRSCTNYDGSGPSAGARLSTDGIERVSCNGRDFQTADCTGGGCKIGKDGTPTNWLLYIGLALIGLMCIGIGAALARGARRGRQLLPPYSVGRAEMQSEYLHESDKKVIQFQPDLTQGVVGANYEYPLHRHLPNGGSGSGSGNGGGGSVSGGLVQNVQTPLPRSVSEHHYDVPHLTTNYALPVDRVSGNESYTSSNYSKRIHSTESLATTTNTSDSTYDVATEPPTLPMSHKNFIKSNTARQIVTSNGSCLKIDRFSVALSIPENSLQKSTKQSLFLSVLNEDSMRLRLAEKYTHVSPIVHSGPPDTELHKPVVLKFPHCAEDLSQWRLSLHHTTAHIQDMEPKWKKIVAIGEETISTPAFVQIDEHHVYVMTQMLGRYALVGESLEMGLGAVKRIKLCFFGPSVHTVSECNIRVYVVEDYPSAVDHCVMVERRVGGTLLGQSSSMFFNDSGQDLNLAIKCVGGWRPKFGTDSQKIPFSHIWNNSLSLHCAFALERTEQDVPGLRLEINARQRQGGEVSAIYVAPFLPAERPVLNIIDEYSESSGSSGKSMTMSDKGISSYVDSDIAFRLTRQSRKELCECLDPLTSRGNDWRMLAQKLGVDRFIGYFRKMPSPTEHVLDLWECRNREPSALADLIGILRCMGRGDAISVLEKCNGPSFV